MSVHLGYGMMGTKTRGSFGLYLEYRLVILLMLMLVLVWFVIKGRVLYAQAAPPDAGVVQVAVANLRSGPGTSYAVVGSALAGEQVQIIGCNEDCSWYQIADELWIASVLVRR